MVVNRCSSKKDLYIRYEKRPHLDSKIALNIEVLKGPLAFKLNNNTSEVSSHVDINSVPYGIITLLTTSLSLPSLTGSIVAYLSQQYTIEILVLKRDPNNKL